MIGRKILTDPIDAHGHEAGAHAAPGPETLAQDNIEGEKDVRDLSRVMEEARAGSRSSRSLNREDESDLKETSRGNDAVLDSPLTQILGVAILEFGVVLHR